MPARSSRSFPSLAWVLAIAFFVTAPVTTVVTVTAAAAAQSSPTKADDVDELVVTGRRLQPVKLALESASVSVITREELARAGGHTLLDALRTELGVNAYASGGPGTLSNLFLRGSNGERLLVLVDGVRVNYAQSGSFDWGLLSSESIERVEILRGPQSTQFGASAAGGVIHIFTRKSSAAPKTSLAASIGTERNYTGGLHASGSTEHAVRYALSVTHQAVSAISAYRRKNGALLPRDAGEVDAWENSVAQGEFSMPLGEFRSTLRARAFDSTNDYDGGFPTDPDDAGPSVAVRDQQASWQLDFPKWRETVRSSLLISHKKQRREDVSPFGNVARTKSTQAAFTSEANFGALWVLGGLDFEEQEAASLARSEDRVGLFVRAEFVPRERLGVDLGVRHEQHSGAENSTTWQAGARYEIHDALQLVASGGSAFRAPSLDQLYGNYGGNPDLKPERSAGFDAGLRWQWDARAKLSLRGEARYFYQSYTEMIVWVPRPTAQNAYAGSNRNVQRARYDGGEFVLRLALGDFWLSAKHTRIQSFASDTGDLLRRGDNAAVEMGFARGDFSGAVAWRHTGARLDYENYPATTVLPAHDLFGLRAGFQLGEHTHLTLHLNNLFDEEYEEIYGYGTLGRNARVNFRYEF